MSKSQLGQDLLVLKHYNNKRNGFFVEIGASDGIEISNTYYLENSFDWRGICIECFPAKYEQLVINRPKAICCSNAVYNESGKKVKFDIANAHPFLSGISEHIDMWRAAVDKDKTTIEVETMTLEDILDKYDAPRWIDYLSLDTEGSEWEILKNFNFQKYKFGLIDVEHNEQREKREGIRRLLEKQGYTYEGANGCDDRYTAKPN